MEDEDALASALREAGLSEKLRAIFSDEELTLKHLESMAPKDLEPNLQEIGLSAVEAARLAAVVRSTTA